jgi:DNA-binding NarL/FixJ family response regulator
MDAPPVQYARTSDGYNIAYNVGGHGRTLLKMPYNFSHAKLRWTAPEFNDTTVSLAERFRVVHFDARGQGLSSRGLSDSHRMEDYLLDMDAVVQAMNLDSFLLFASLTFWRAAVAYASKNPHRIEALILLNPEGKVEGSNQPHQFDLEARTNWDFFLGRVASAGGSYPSDFSTRLLVKDQLKECMEQADYLKMLNAIRTCDARQWLATTRVPTLVIQQRELHQGSTPVEVAAAIPGASLLLLEELGSSFHSATSRTHPGVTAIEEFVDKLAAVQEREPAVPAGVSPAILSPRQAEVLQLIAEGRSNKEIAEQLVLSLRTVERHVADLYTKLDIRNRAEATAFAMNLPNRR